MPASVCRQQRRGFDSERGFAEGLRHCFSSDRSRVDSRVSGYETLRAAQFRPETNSRFGTGRRRSLAIALLTEV